MLRVPSHLPTEVEELTTRVIGCCIAVHRALGPGLLEGIYSRAICLEVKSVERLVPVHHAQLLSYLRVSRLKNGLLVNFNVPVLQDGLKRIVL